MAGDVYAPPAGTLIHQAAALVDVMEHAALILNMLVNPQGDLDVERMRVIGNVGGCNTVSLMDDAVLTDGPVGGAQRDVGQRLRKRRQHDQWYP